MDVEGENVRPSFCLTVTSLARSTDHLPCCVQLNTMADLELSPAGPSKPAQHDPPAIETLAKLDAGSFDIGAYEGSYKGE